MLKTEEHGMVRNEYHRRYSPYFQSIGDLPSWTSQVLLRPPMAGGPRLIPDQERDFWSAMTSRPSCWNRSGERTWRHDLRSKPNGAGFVTIFATAAADASNRWPHPAHYIVAMRGSTRRPPALGAADPDNTSDYIPIICCYNSEW